MAEVISMSQPSFPLPDTAMSHVESVIEGTPIPGTECGPYGERLVVQVMDELASKTPDRIWATITRSPYDVDEGFRDITIRQLADAVNCTAWFMHNKFGKSPDFEVVAYLGVSDIRYAIYMFGAIKTGHQLMIPSVRNSLPQHLSVFDAAKCNKVFYTPEMKDRIEELKQHKPGLQAFEVPSLDELITASSKQYPYTKNWREARTDPILVAHSSGSTGNPKPTTITNGVYSVYDNHRKIQPIPGRRIQSYLLLEFEGGGRFFNPFPPFHLAGLFAMTIMPIFYTCTVTMGPPEKPPSGEILSKAMQKLKIRAAWCPPTVIEQLVALPGGFEQAVSLDWIMYTGGPLAPAVGDKLSKVTDVCQLYGSTETGPHIAMVPLPGNWNYFEWHPLLENEMDPMGDGTYEMVVHKDPSLDWIRHLSQAYPHLNVWRTNDLFVQSPNNPKLWRFTGRRDDVLVLSNGEKFNPVTMEGIITGHPDVRGALIVGTARFQASLIVEPAPGVDLPDHELIDRIWPTVEKANAAGPAHGRIFRSKVVIAKPDKPFLRAGKGTVIRGLTTKLYAEEVDKLYNDNDESDAGAPSLEDPGSLESVTVFVRESLARVLSQTDLADFDDLFVRGMDSLQTLELTKSLRRAFSSSAQKGDKSYTLTAANIYANPTIEKLGKFIFRLLNNESGDDACDREDRTALMARLVNKYTNTLPTAVSTPVKQSCVAITGTTGSLGTHLLEALINDSRISKVYCLNRSDDALSRHLKAFEARKKNYDLGAKTVFLTIKLGSPKFGLSNSEYQDLTNEVDAIVHNAWKVDFNHQLASFEDVHIRGVRDLIDLSLASPRHPHLFFVSSLSSVGNWPNCYDVTQEIPETVLDNFNVALPMGYGESKHVSERIIDSAVKTSGLNASILRVGQIAGPLAPDGGQWNPTEWFPGLVKTSKELGWVPDSMNAIDWIPVDTLAQIFKELIHANREKGESQVFNLVNPHAANWEDLVAAMQAKLQPKELKVVSFGEWLETLSNVKDPDLDELPALKIIDFYTALANEAKAGEAMTLKYDTSNGRTASQTMVNLSPINAEAMDIWLDQWKF